MKTIIFLAIVGLGNSLLFLLTFKSFSDFTTRQSVMTGSIIFTVLAIAYLIQELYKSYRESKIEPIETYFDEEQPITQAQPQPQEELKQELKIESKEDEIAQRFRQNFGGKFNAN